MGTSPFLGVPPPELPPVPGLPEVGVEAFAAGGAGAEASSAASPEGSSLRNASLLDADLGGGARKAGHGGGEGAGGTGVPQELEEEEAAQRAWVFKASGRR